MSDAPCRHFLGMYPDRRPQCAMGRDVRAWAIRCNGGSENGIGLRLPCTKQIGDEKPLFDCPSLDRKTDAEVEAERAQLRKRMDKILSSMPMLNEMREKMIAGGISSAKATCPWCGEKGALRITCAIGYNNHIHAHCDKCREGFIE